MEIKRNLDHLSKIVAVFVLILLSSCVSAFTNYESLTLSDQQVAVIKENWGCSPCVARILSEDGKTWVYDKRRDGGTAGFKLTPGIYIIEYSCESYKIEQVFRTDRVELKAGHTYRVKCKACYTPHALVALIFGGVCRGPDYRIVLWIEDETTREVVAGDRPSLGLKRRLVREYERLQMVDRQIREVVAERAHALKTSESSDVQKVRQLLDLRGIGINSSWLYVMEFFGWREFRNRREVGGSAGLVPTPHQSGDEAWERGISKAGNGHIRSMAIQIAWAWLRWQPQSQLSRWYEQRFAHGSPRLRRIGIVALARKLLVDLWRYLENGVIPEGAQLKA